MTTESTQIGEPEQLKNSAELKKFLRSLLDKMTEKSAPPIHVVGVFNSVLNQPNIYEILDTDNKELARDVWLRLKASGLQLRNPPLLFPNEQ